MKHVWAPWRMVYIQGELEEDGCLFCNRLKMMDGAENLILYRGEHTFIILNRFPYTNGHVMVVPYAHQPTLEGLSAETLTELMQLVNRSLAVLRTVYGAQAFNVGVNIGEAAGAGVEEHVHMHVVPRWAGDTNFMATTAETRVLPEALLETYEKLREAWTELPANADPSGGTAQASPPSD